MLRLNILICAHEISPIQGSECAEGWNIVLELSKYHNLFVLHASGSQFNPNAYEIAINEYFHKHENSNKIKFISIKQPRLTLFLARVNKFFYPKNSAIGNPLLYFWGYRIWHYKAYKTAKKLKDKYKIDLVHLLTSITFREPGYLWNLNLPYVWGPTGGLSKLPKSFKNDLLLKDRIIENIRELITFVQFNFNYRISKTIEKCNLVYTFSEFDRNCFNKRGFNYIKTLTDSGCTIMSDTINNLETNKIELPLKIIWIGQLVKRKALDILINSVDLLEEDKKIKVSITIIGSGPLYNYYQKLINEKKLSNNFKFIGFIDREKLFILMKKSHVLVHTSYREATTNVIPEALSNSLPVICHDISGMSIAIDKSCGFKIQLLNYDRSISDLSKILSTLVENPDLLIDLKKGARQRANILSWKNIGYTMATDYKSIISNESIINK